MAKSNQTKGRSDGLIAENRRSRRDYEVEDTLEAGIVLVGSEVKALREGKANIAEAYVSPEDGELWLVNCEIQTYAGANRFNHEPRRKRKLLVSRRELAKLSQEVERAGRTIVPLKFYFNDRGIAKLLIGTATGRKNYDKRNVEAKRDWARQKARILKEG
ncbi:MULTISPECIES: SsrA-binding protein SmpB [Hyphomonas]|uniref:SsrA-binding protein n=1 Tax=Hyphomonas adhaerens TaxID=81029 RepID=A0A3B9H1H6_9PROT|nr:MULTISPECIES: SsrA-binding protein SmpB [Hyphomonas]MBB40648.1 SsrA-binding protein [Hyphomonas sp.]HAE28508.1 SsrA-binding protein [Hyphomonas adhaerens]|tara:strand:+ start:2145 stop:2624 length:480 start_codon:yes stop_codon:yes gene_type:complete